MHRSSTSSCDRLAPSSQRADGVRTGPSGELVRNQWLHWEAVFVGNSSGAADGTVDWWADGVKIGHYSGLQFVSGAGLWEELEWSPTYGGFGAAVPADQYQWIDHLYISGKAN